MLFQSLSRVLLRGIYIDTNVPEKIKIVLRLKNIDTGDRVEMVLSNPDGKLTIRAVVGGQEYSVDVDYNTVMIQPAVREAVRGMIYSMVVMMGFMIPMREMFSLLASTLAMT